MNCAQFWQHWKPRATSNDIENQAMTLEISPTATGYRLNCEVHLPASREKVFQFFSDATQLERLTPAWLNFRMQTPTPLDMQEGTLIEYKLRVHGIPLRWQSRISCWEPPFRFVDEQLRGPYRHWHHLHTFEDDGQGTNCRDEVDYSFFGGRLVHELFVKRDLEKIFAYRTQMLQQIFALSPAMTDIASH